MDARTITQAHSNTRLDSFIVENLLTELSRSQIQRFIEQGQITVNGSTVKAGYKLRQGDIVAVTVDTQKLREVPTISIPTIYEDEDCIVLDKPIGVLTHSKGAFNPEATVATFIADKVRGMDGDRAGIVHRLDRATSGVIICAKNPEALSWLQKQFSQRKTKKAYMAVVNGHLDPSEAIIDMPIERDPAHPKQFRVGKAGRSAQTNYRVVESNDHFSRVELRPVTGRTHQLRVQLRQLKHPIVGDNLYGGTPYERLMLHAYELEITLPNRERKVFSSRLPKAFSDIMK